MALVEMLTFSSLESKTPAAVGLMLKLSSVGAEREMTGLISAASSWVELLVALEPKIGAKIERMAKPKIRKREKMEKLVAVLKLMMERFLNNVMVFPFSFYYLDSLKFLLY